MTSGKKDMYSDLRGHSMYIATRRARLEAREAGFLVYQIVIHPRQLFVILSTNKKKNVDVKIGRSKLFQLVFNHEIYNPDPYGF